MEIEPGAERNVSEDKESLGIDNCRVASAAAVVDRSASGSRRHAVGEQNRTRDSPNGTDGKVFRDDLAFREN